MPNGNRTYYLSRSQPPFFAAMVELVATGSATRDAIMREFLPRLSQEYAFWMEGADRLAPGSAHRRVVRLQRRHAAQPLLGRPRHARARSPIARTSRRRARRADRRRRSIAICAPPPKAAGTSARAGWRTARRSRPSTRPNSCRSISTACCSSSRRRSPRPTRPPRAGKGPPTSAPAPARARRRCDAISGTPRRAYSPTISGARASRSGGVTAATLYPLFFGLATEAQARSRGGRRCAPSC